MTPRSISEPSWQYPTQEEINAALARAHRLRAEAFLAGPRALARGVARTARNLFPAPRDECQRRFPQPMRAAHA